MEEIDMAAKRLLSIAAATILALGAISAVAAADFPNKPVHVIVPYPAGGIVDIVARSITQQISEDWGQPMIVEAKAGAQSNLGTQMVAKSAPDGYTWLMTGPAILVNPSMFKDAGYETLRDFRAVGVGVWNQNVAVVPSELPVKTMKEFVSYTKSHPGIFFGHGGLGTSQYLTAGQLFQAAEMKMEYVGYKGQPPALLDLIKNRVQFEIVSLKLAMPHIKDGTIKPLAVFTNKRIKALPDVPTIAEAGYPNAAYVPWYGIFIPAATPEKVAERVNAAINKALSTPAVVKRLESANIPGDPMTLQALDELMKSDTKKLRELIRTSGIKPK